MGDESWEWAEIAILALINLLTKRIASSAPGSKFQISYWKIYAILVLLYSNVTECTGHFWYSEPRT